MKNQEKFLPIGSVVTLKDKSKKVMIIGYASVDSDKLDQIYDYCACLFPEGIIRTDQNLLLNHEDIEEIISLGYVDEEQKDFNATLKELLSEENRKVLLNQIKSDETMETLE